jgi:hypothetical protein
MKKFIIMLFIISLGVAGYFFLKPEEQLIEIVKAQVELQQIGGGMNFETPSVTQRRFAARIKGTIKNISDKELKNIVLAYKLGNKTVTTNISSLEAGKSKSFVTDRYETPNRTPKMELISVEYELK